MILYVCAFFSFLVFAQASKGDSSSHFQICLQDCKRRDCSTNQSLFETKQPFYLRFMGWNCREECKYQCMWPTIKVFQENDIDVPQFYGKSTWCTRAVFKCGFGFEYDSSYRENQRIQTNIYKHVSNVLFMAIFGSALSPLVMGNINAWFWSYMFHTKDNFFNERLDYFSAFTLILIMAYICSVRMSLGMIFVPIVIGTCLSILFVYHIYYMSFVLFDYGYNMKVVTIVGVTTLVIWMLWFIKVRQKQPYAVNVFICSLCTLLLMSLWTLDSPPIFWLLDVHAIWHFGTVPLIFLWYRFIVDDLVYLKGLEGELLITRSDN